MAGIKRKRPFVIRTHADASEVLLSIRIAAPGNGQLVALNFKRQNLPASLKACSSIFTFLKTVLIRLASPALAANTVFGPIRGV
jgi:hypothetical protein